MMSVSFILSLTCVLIIDLVWHLSSRVWVFAFFFILLEINNLLYMTTIEPGEDPSRTISLKPLVFLSHIKCRTNDDRFSSSQWESLLCFSLGVFPLLFSWDLLRSVHATLFLMIFSGIICRRVKLSQRFLRFMTGWFTRWDTTRFRGSSG